MEDKQSYTETLFSYGTLQYESVQIANFGRKLNGLPDVLQGYSLSQLTIRDPRVLDKSGDASHPIIQYTGDFQDEVNGYVFNISKKELEQADQYEVDDYKRIQVTLKSGKKAWAYVDAILCG